MSDFKKSLIGFALFCACSMTAYHFNCPLIFWLGIPCATYSFARALRERDKVLRKLYGKDPHGRF